MSEIKLVDHQHVRKLYFDEEFSILGFRYEKEYVALQSLNYLSKLLEYKNKSVSIIHILERFQNPHFIYTPLFHMLYGYIGTADISRISNANSCMIDYGSGYGASSFALAKIFPKSNVLGLEYSQERTELSNILALENNLSDRIKFCRAEGNNLEKLISDNTNSVKLVLLNAVVEHIHPNERQEIIETLYSFLEPGGYLVILDTPNALFPIDNHTTQLPLIPYLPIGLKVRFAKLLLGRFRKATEEQLIFEGIVGSSILEIRRILNKNYANTYNILKPARNLTDTWFVDRFNKKFNMFKIFPLYLLYKVFELFNINTEYMLTQLRLVIKKK